MHDKIQKYLHTHLHTHTCTCVYTHWCAHIHVHAHTHTPMWLMIDWWLMIIDWGLWWMMIVMIDNCDDWLLLWWFMLMIYDDYWWWLWWLMRIVTVLHLNLVLKGLNSLLRLVTLAAYKPVKLLPFRMHEDFKSSCILKPSVYLGKKNLWRNWGETLV